MRRHSLEKLIWPSICNQKASILNTWKAKRTRISLESPGSSRSQFGFITQQREEWIRKAPSRTLSCGGVCYMDQNHACFSFCPYLKAFCRGLFIFLHRLKTHRKKAFIYMIEQKWLGPYSTELLRQANAGGGFRLDFQVGAPSLASRTFVWDTSFLNKNFVFFMVVWRHCSESLKFYVRIHQHWGVCLKLFTDQPSVDPLRPLLFDCSFLPSLLGRLNPNSKLQSKGPGCLWGPS